jgi:hypothetical protein
MVAPPPPAHHPGRAFAGWRRTRMASVQSSSAVIVGRSSSPCLDWPQIVTRGADNGGRGFRPLAELLDANLRRRRRQRSRLRARPRWNFLPRPS